MKFDKRRAAKWGGAAVGLLVLLIAMAPYLASMGLFRDTLLRAVMPPIHGSVHCAGASLGWFSPVLFQEIEIRSADDAPVVTVDRLEGNRPLWKMLLNRRDLGEFRIDRPQLNVVLSEHGPNLAEVFVGRPEDEKQRPSKPPNVSLRIELVDGSLSCRGADSPRTWAARPINFAFALEPSSASAEGQPQLVIEPGTVLPRTRVTPEACHDLLMYIAPILAGATEVGGEFSIEVDRWRLPLAEPASGEGSGRLTISSLDVGPGPLVAELAALLGVPPKLRIVEDSPVTFRMADGRIHHSDLEFRIDRLVVRTHGSVGLLDGSLALVADVDMPKHLLGDGPLASALAGQTLAIPIAGTLSHPRIDAEGLGDSGLDLLSGTLGDLLKDDKVDLGAMIKDGKADLGAVLKAIQQLRRRGKATADPSGKAPGDKPAPLLDAFRGALGEKTPVLDRLRQRRQDRDASPRDPKGADPP